MNNSNPLGDDLDFMDLLGPEIAQLRDPIKPVRFGQAAIVTAEFQMAPAQALQHSVNNPEHPAALPPGRVARITANNIRYNFMNMLANNEANAQKWLEQVAATSPKTALELLIDIAQFITPKLKAIAIATRDETDPLKAAQAQALRGLSVEDLQKKLAGE